MLNGLAMRLGVSIAALCALGACSDAFTDAPGGGGGALVCGLNCSGTVACQEALSGTVSAQGSACVMNFPGQRATLACDHSVSLVNSDGSSETGTWSGLGSSVTFTFAGVEQSCTISPVNGGGSAGAAGSGS